MQQAKQPIPASAQAGRDAPAPSAPMTLQPHELKLVSGGSPRGGWVVSTEAAAMSPRGGW